MTTRRRLFVLAFAVVSPVLAACSVSPTGVDDDPTPPPPADSTSDSTKFGDTWPWG